MKTTLDLPDELVREVKLRAVTQGRTVKDLVADLLSRGLGLMPLERSAVPRAGSRVEIGEQGLPLIRCAPDAPASRMSPEDLLALEQETQTGEDRKRAGLAI